MTTKKKTLKEVTETIKEYGWPILKTVAIGTAAYVSRDIVDAGIDSLFEGLKSMGKEGLDAIVNHPDTKIISETIPELAQSALLYFLPRKFMNTKKQKGKEGGYYTEQVLKYLMQTGAVLRGVDAGTNFFETTIPYVSSSASVTYNNLMNRIGAYIGLASIAAPFLDKKNKPNKK